MKLLALADQHSPIFGSDKDNCVVIGHGLIATPCPDFLFGRNQFAVIPGVSYLSSGVNHDFSGSLENHALRRKGISVHGLTRRIPEASHCGTK